nr:MAG TPA: hypothetical protein [Caudoviricetes sp.]
MSVVDNTDTDLFGCACRWLGGVEKIMLKLLYDRN